MNFSTSYILAIVKAIA